MPREKYERREKTEKFQTFSRPKVKVVPHQRIGQGLHRLQGHRVAAENDERQRENPLAERTGASAMEQRMVARAVKRARYLALLPYVSAMA